MDDNGSGVGVCAAAEYSNTLLERGAQAACSIATCHIIQGGEESDNDNNYGSGTAMPLCSEQKIITRLLQSMQPLQIANSNRLISSSGLHTLFLNGSYNGFDRQVLPSQVFPVGITTLTMFLPKLLMWPKQT